MKGIPVLPSESVDLGAPICDFEVGIIELLAKQSESNCIARDNSLFRYCVILKQHAMHYRENPSHRVKESV